MTEREYENYIIVMDDIEGNLNKVTHLVYKCDRRFVAKNRILDCDIVDEIHSYKNYVKKSGSIAEIHSYLVEISDACARLINRQRRVINTYNMRIKETENLITKLTTIIKLKKEYAVYADLNEAFDLCHQMEDVVEPFVRATVVK